MSNATVVESRANSVRPSDCGLPLTNKLNCPAIELVPVQVSDEPFLYRTYASTRTEELAITGWNEEQKDKFLRMQYEAQKSSYRMQSPEAKYWVIRSKGNPAGRLTIERTPSEVRIVDIAFVPEFRGQGIGTAVMRIIQQEAAQSNKWVRLHVERFNPALRWYKRMGFEIVGGGPIYLQMVWRAVNRTSGEVSRRFDTPAPESTEKVCYVDSTD